MPGQSLARCDWFPTVVEGSEDHCKRAACFQRSSIEFHAIYAVRGVAERQMGIYGCPLPIVALPWYESISTFPSPAS